MIFYVMGTAALYIAVGYYLGRRLLHAPMPEFALDIAADDLTQAEQLEAMIDGPEEPQPSAEDATESPVSEFNALEELPAQWLKILGKPSELKSFIEASVHVLRLEVGKYRERLVNIDADLRQCLRSPNADKLQAAVDQLRNVNSEWMDRQAEAASYLLERRGVTGEMTTVRDRLNEVLQTQAAQIETTCGNLEMFDFKASPLIGARRLVIEVRKLVDVSHTLRDCMQELLLTILVHEGRLDASDKGILIDSLTGLKNRAGIEIFIRKWWNDDGRRVRQISVAMFDLDRFASLLERFGARATDQLLAAVARLVDDMLRKYSGLDWCGRLAGQRFFIFCADTGPHGATSFVERIRQTIAKTTFELPTAAIEITFSAAVTEVLNDDTTKSLFKRLNSVLRAAKLAGRNRTFRYDGNAPAAVEPPEFDVRGKIVRVEV